MKMLTLFMIAFAIRSTYTQQLGAVHEDLNSEPAAQSVTGEQAERILTAAKGKSDDRVAKRLYSLEPASRFGSATIKNRQIYLEGPKAKQAFTVLADLSVFLGPPAGETPPPALPDVATQKEMLTLATEYVARTVRHLPNFYATRSTSSFARNLNSKLRLHLVGKHDATAYYRGRGTLGRDRRINDPGIIRTHSRNSNA